MADAVWFCYIGQIDREHLPNGSDQPMRLAVEREYSVVTGDDAQFTFSGWGAELPEKYRAVVEDREPVPTGVVLIELERWRQVNTGGYTPAHDAGLVNKELIGSAVAHIAYVDAQATERPIRELVKAGALIAAEIDRRIAAGEGAW